MNMNYSEKRENVHRVVAIMKVKHCWENLEVKKKIPNNYHWAISLN